MITGKNYIGFDQMASGTVTYRTFDPIANRENENLFVAATSEEVDKAVQLAVSAFATYRNMSGQRKAAFLNAIADEIMALDEELIQRYCLESGLPEGRAKGERGRTVGQLRAFAELVAEGSWVEAIIDTGKPERQPIPKPDLRKLSIPLGPVAVFGASNFPLAYSTAGGDTAAALAAGCPVLVKSHPMHAGTGELVASAVIKAAKDTGMPNGVFSNLNSKGIEVGTQLVSHSGVKAVGFTGSIKGGRALFDLAAQRAEPIPVFAEMGSINPVIVLPSAVEDSALDDWAAKYASSITLGGGQFCTNPGLLLGLKGTALDGFIASLDTEIKKMTSHHMLHPNIHQNFENGRAELSAQSGVSVVGSYNTLKAPNTTTNTVLTVSGSDFLKNPILHKEVFGPFSIVVSCSDKEELRTIIAQLEGQLTGTVLGKKSELEAYKDVVAALGDRVGRIIFNGVPTGVEVCPAMLHGGPYPASTDSRFTAVGVYSIRRWVRPFSFQDWPDATLPEALQNANPLKLNRLVDGNWTTEPLMLETSEI